MKRAQRILDGVKVEVKGKNMSVNNALRDYVVEKMRKLNRYLDRVKTIEVELSAQSTRETSHQRHVEAITRVAGRTIRVTAEHNEMHAAVDAVVDKLYRQLVRQKERMKSHHADKLSELIAIEGPSLETEGDGAAPESDQITRIERLEMKPLFEDEAIEELTELGYSFFVFLNARNEQVNVLYRRSDNTYGLIEPRIA